MKKYKIRDGFAFIKADRTSLGGGEIIELPDDVAQDHLHKLEPVQTSARKAPAAPKPAATDPASPAELVAEQPTTDAAPADAAPADGDSAGGA